MMYYLRYLIDTITYPLRMLMYAPGRIFSGSRRFLGISLPARVAILTFIFLIICVAVTLVLFINLNDRTFVRSKLTASFYTVVAILVAAIPLVLYKALKLWLEGELSPFPDIDHAWKTGLAELERQGLDITQTPLFLILGSAGERQEKALFAASQLSLNVREFPNGPAALHWYANPDGIYLVCTETSSLSTLSRLAARAAEEAVQNAPPLAPRPNVSSLRGTIIAGSPAEREKPAPSHPSKPECAIGGQPSVRGMAAIQGTMILDTSDSASGKSGVADAGDRRLIKLTQSEGMEQERRLEYVCRLIFRSRQPLCPVNGLLTLLPFRLIQKSDSEAAEVQHAVKRDLAAVRRVFMLRSAVTALIVGLEEESGFAELVRRVGRDRAVGQRFGRGFSLSNPPIPERLEALCAHACGSFEDWVYTLFEKGTLNKHGNTKLYALLCKIRLHVRNRLEEILITGYGFDPDKKDPQSDVLLFGGCYFAATGDTEDRQAFVKGVFDKLPEQQEELEWAEEALRQDQKYQFYASVGLCIDTLLLIGLASLIVYKWWFRS